MNALTKRLTVLAASSLLAVSTFWLPPSPARADSAHGCPYPYACVYSEPELRGHIVAKYKVVTSGYQSVTVEGHSVYNTRNDDIVEIESEYWVRLPDGSMHSATAYACLPPNSWGQVDARGEGIEYIRIDSRSTC